MPLRCLKSWSRSLCAFTTVLVFMAMASQTASAAIPIPLTHVPIPEKNVVISHAATSHFLSRLSYGAARAFPFPARVVTIQVQYGTPPPPVPRLLCYTFDAYDWIIARGQPATTDKNCRFTLTQLGTGYVTLKASNNKYVAIYGDSNKVVLANQPTTDDPKSQFFMMGLLSNHTVVFQSRFTGFFLNVAGFFHNGGMLQAGSDNVDDPQSQFTLQDAP